MHLSGFQFGAVRKRNEMDLVNVRFFFNFIFYLVCIVSQAIFLQRIWYIYTGRSSQTVPQEIKILARTIAQYNADWRKQMKMIQNPIIPNPITKPKKREKKRKPVSLHVSMFYVYVLLLGVLFVL